MICKLQIANHESIDGRMKKHSGMRPQDILVLLTIPAISIGEIAGRKFMFIPPNNKQIAELLEISQSEVSESLARSAYAGLISNPKLKEINKLALLDFIKCGLKYVFPVHPTGIGRGVPTAHSASPLQDEIISEETFVWELAEGTTRGLLIEPLYHTVPAVSLKNEKLYEVFALLDGIRTGKSRVAEISFQLLKEIINEGWPITKTL